MYVDGFHDRERDEIKIVERVNGQRIYKTYSTPYCLYYLDPNGSHQSIFGDRLSKFTTTSGKAFRREKLKHDRMFESDINPVFRCLSDNYRQADTPKLHIAFFDIEVGFDPKRGFAPIDDTFAPITAISLYYQWLDKLVTVVLRPPTISEAEGDIIAGQFDNTLVFTDECEMIDAFLKLIDDVDIISGWNSEGYDIPYIVNRIIKLMGNDESTRLSLWNQKPRPRTYMKFKREFSTYDIIGRVHLDYWLLYQKHNPQQLHSYRLDFVAEHEVGDHKIPYDGTLDNLYKKDFKKFIEYNRQDVMLLSKIDKKKQFIELSNQVAHQNTVLLRTTMGSVALIEQAILNEMHDHHVIAPDCKAEIDEIISIDDDDDDDEDGEPVIAQPVVGAYVARPKLGLHDDVGAVDIKSLYPSTLRALNMSPETIVGQIRCDDMKKYIEDKVAGVRVDKRAEAWDGIFAVLEFDHVINKDDTMLTVDFEDGSSSTYSAKALYDYIFAIDSNLVLSANGTIFNTSRAGIIPGLLAKWYREREETQAKAADYAQMADGITIDEELERQLNSL